MTTTQKIPNHVTAQENNQSEQLKVSGWRKVIYVLVSFLLACIVVHLINQYILPLSDVTYAAALTGSTIMLFGIFFGIKKFEKMLVFIHEHEA